MNQNTKSSIYYEVVGDGLKGKEAELAYRKSQNYLPLTTEKSVFVDWQRLQEKIIKAVEEQVEDEYRNDFDPYHPEDTEERLWKKFYTEEVT